MKEKFEMITKAACLACFPEAMQGPIREYIVMAAETQHDRTWYQVPAQQQEIAKSRLDKAESNLLSISSDRRVVGATNTGDCIFMFELWRDALGQLAYECRTGLGRWEAVALKAHVADDAQQCADDLGIQVVEDWRTELERVGLGHLLDSADLSPSGGPLWRLRTR